MTFGEWAEKQGFPVTSTQRPLWLECWEEAQRNTVTLDKQLLDWFETLPRYRQNDILNDTRFDTFRGKLLNEYVATLVENERV